MLVEPEFEVPSLLDTRLEGARYEEPYTAQKKCAQRKHEHKTNHFVYEKVVVLPDYLIGVTDFTLERFEQPFYFIYIQYTDHSKHPR